MRYVVLSIATLLLCICWQNGANGQANSECAAAEVCGHNGKEKCGIDDGKPRRFLDSCDMLEYNCRKSKYYVQTEMEQCSDLPPIPANMINHKKSKNNNAGLIIEDLRTLTKTK